ncbi:hypothetical protein [Helicobacter labacensis]|uniref:hypothetical protein n=1 Tax=Helicobacter labacensis TaxID=2316079 RepID=UPI0013CE3470|nr:hypothetical protein [Helicobacter labacensis]
MKNTRAIFTRALFLILSLCLSWHSLHALELKEAQAVVKKWVDDYWKQNADVILKGESCIHNDASEQWSETIYDQEDARTLTKGKPDKSKAYTLIFYQGCIIPIGAHPDDALHTCMGILHKGQLSKGFCTDTPLDIEVKNNLLVISKQYQEVGFDDHYSADQYAFEMLRGRFYLRTYSKQVFSCHDPDNAHGCPDPGLTYLYYLGGDLMKLLGSHLYYSQPRDDPQGKFRISMQDFLYFWGKEGLDDYVGGDDTDFFGKGALLYKLRSACFRSQKCKHLNLKALHKVCDNNDLYTAGYCLDSTD